MRQQWKRKEYLEKLRDKNLRSLLKYVYNNNQFYHRIYRDYKEVIYNFKGFQDLPKLPLIEKEDIQKYGNEILGKAFLYSKLEKEGNYSVNGYTIRKTSGFSGQPLSVIYDSSAWDWSEAIYARALFASGYRANDILMLSYPYAVPNKDWFNYFGLMRKNYIPPNIKADKQLELLLAERQRFTFHSFPSILLMLSREIEQSCSKPNVSRIISTGECLTEHVRKRIEADFCCAIYNHYGAMEFNRIAWECNMHEGLHINIDALAVELLKDGKQVSEGERGEITITGLYNYAYPLIRYRLGDFGKLSRHKCSCKRGLPLLESVAGRSSDFIITSDNRIIPTVITYHTLDKIRGVSQFKLEQDKDKKLTLYIVKKDNPTNDVNADAMQQLCKLDPNAKAKIIFTKKIKRNQGGKLSSVVSRCSQKI